MTEDEAFIRAIVDSPGDDTPRLVYADWLDDRGDPRGAYLRAEFEWAKPWRDGTCPDDRPELCEVATGFDPVWVARITRPPLGVCCDHVRFIEHGPILAHADIDRAEERLGGRFPIDFRAFLLNYNGVKPAPPFCRDPYSGDRDGPLSCFVERFFVLFPLGEGHSSEGNATLAPGIESQRSWLERVCVDGSGEGQNPLIAGMVPVARTAEPLAGHILLTLTGPAAGRVFHLPEYAHRGGEPGDLEDWSPRFAAFLATFGPDLDNYIPGSAPSSPQ